MAKQIFGEMISDNLFELYQNVVLNTIALQSFTHGYHDIAKHKESIYDFPKLNYMFYVLPIVYNENALKIFGSSTDLYTAIIKDPSIILGLQERANKMARQTFDGLNLGFSKKILTINTANNTILLEPGFRGKKLALMLKMNDSQNSVKRIQDCAHRLGNIFAKKNEKNIQIELNIRF